MPDNATLLQSQPLCRCNLTSNVTTLYRAPDANLYGDGILGAHGGSGLSSIGGTLRLGELFPDEANGGLVRPARHALKGNLFGHLNYFRNGTYRPSSFRWPAVSCDGYFDDGSSISYNGTNPALKPGSLLALNATVDITKLGLVTVPALHLAWTLQNYGRTCSRFTSPHLLPG
jgi:hypothetical protein